MPPHLQHPMYQNLNPMALRGMLSFSHLALRNGGVSPPSQLPL